MKKYETPEISIEKYGLVNNIMDGYINGDIDDDPFKDLYTTQPTESGEGVDANILD